MGAGSSSVDNSVLMAPAKKISVAALVALRADDGRIAEKPLRRLRARQVTDSVPWRTGIATAAAAGAGPRPPPSTLPLRETLSSLLMQVGNADDYRTVHHSFERIPPSSSTSSSSWLTNALEAYGVLAEALTGHPPNYTPSERGPALTPIETRTYARQRPTRSPPNG